MKFHSNGWIPAFEFPRVADLLHRVATTEHTRWFERSKFKYITLRIDQRTGDFAILDRNNLIVSSDELYEIFPELNDESNVRVIHER